MDQTLEVANIEVLPSAKVWERQRVYEKRLSAIVSKENRKPIFLAFSVHLFIPLHHKLPKLRGRGRGQGLIREKMRPMVNLRMTKVDKKWVRDLVLDLFE